MFEIITEEAPDEIQVVRADDLFDLVRRYPSVLYVKQIG